MVSTQVTGKTNQRQQRKAWARCEKMASALMAIDQASAHPTQVSPNRLRAVEQIENAYLKAYWDAYTELYRGTGHELLKRHIFTSDLLTERRRMRKLMKQINGLV